VPAGLYCDRFRWERRETQLPFMRRVLKSSGCGRCGHPYGKSSGCAPGMVRSLQILATVILCLALSGCYVAFRGHASSDGGVATTTTAGSVVRASSSGVHIAFGSPHAPDGTGGQISFGRGASALVVLGLVIAESVNYLSGMFRENLQAQSGPQRSISSTCSCYGRQPELTSAPAPQ